ncbi:hypothetical protein BGZ73_000482, partial [Actinomortierella ambigua]
DIKVTVMKYNYLYLLLVALFATFCVGAEVPVRGQGLDIDLSTALDLDAQGVTVTAVGGAISQDVGINLPTASGSSLTYDDRVVSGRVVFMGGLQLSLGARRVAISDLSLDIKTGVTTAKIGGNAGVSLGTVDVSDAHATKNEGSTKLTVILDKGLHLEPSALADIDAQLGTTSNTQEGITTDASIRFDLDLAAGGKVNIALITALGLGQVIPSDMGLQELIDHTVDSSITL